MPYITVMQSPRFHQITLDEILSGEIQVSDIAPRSVTGTVTHYSEHLNERLARLAQTDELIGVLETFIQKNETLYEKNRSKLYNTFYIAKRSGGLRKINAPLEELMTALRELKDIFETRFSALYHTSAFAYVKCRSTIDAVKKHQMNSSRWFLKTDFSDFFGSTTSEFLMRMLGQIYPFSEVVKNERGRAALEKALDLCFLDGGLPQGTPISPMLTNLMMIPIDHRIANELRHNNFVYTRYADDIIISHKFDFSASEKCDFINRVLDEFNAPFKIKQSKTRYGSSSGKNWNLGVMLNKDNKITIGHQKKKTFKAMCCSYIASKQNNQPWDRHDLEVFNGLISYYKMVEKDYILYTIDHYNQKYGVNMMAMIREDLR